MERIHADIAGRFSIVSRTSEGAVLVGFLGNVYPRNLSAGQIDYIKTFYCIPDGEHEFFDDWPEDIEPAYPAAKRNFKNGFMLIRRKAQ